MQLSQTFGQRVSRVAQSRCTSSARSTWTYLCSQTPAWIRTNPTKTSFRLPIISCLLNRLGPWLNLAKHRWSNAHVESKTSSSCTRFRTREVRKSLKSSKWNIIDWAMAPCSHRWIQQPLTKQTHRLRSRPSRRVYLKTIKLRNICQLRSLGIKIW